MISRLGHRLRSGGAAQLNDHDNWLILVRFETIVRRVRELLLERIDWRDASVPDVDFAFTGMAPRAPQPVGVARPQGDFV